MGTLLFIVGDTGAAKELLRFARYLELLGWTIRWVADPKGKAIDEVLVPAEVVYQTGPGEFWFDGIRAVVVGTSATAASAGNEWTEYIRGHSRAPVIWYADLYGTENKPSMDGFDPNFLFVLDKMHAENANKKRPDVPKVIVGKPSFAVTEEQLKAAEDMRIDLEIKHSGGQVRFQSLIVTLLTGGERVARAREHLDRVVRFLRTYRLADDIPLICLPRIHGKLDKVESGSVAKLTEMVRDLADNRGYPKLAIDFPKSTESCVLASDLVIADWGCTDAYRALALGIPVMMFTNMPEDGERLAEVYADGVPPAIRSGAAVQISDNDTLLSIGECCTHIVAAARRVRFKGGSFRHLALPGAEERFAAALERVIAPKP